MKRALITGISGQDGSYLSEYLLSLGYEVHGIIRRHSTPENQENRIAHLSDMITTYYGDIAGQSSLEKIMKIVMPDEIYNLAAQSHVRISFDIPSYTFNTNAVGVLNMLEAYKSICPKARFYQASSSEMFGNSVEEGWQRETTPMRPVSPYGCSKVAAFHLVRHYREAYGLYAVNGILFNHESPRRGTNFVTNKVVKSAVRIKLGLDDHVELGNLDSKRDWGHSKDYVRAMHLILNSQFSADDFVVATGEARSVREMCSHVFGRLDLDYHDYVRVNDKFLRPNELDYLRGDSSRIRKMGWVPEYDFELLMEEMIDHWMKVYGG